MSIQTEWAVLTGPPGSGKTTVLNLLAARGYLVLDDVSRKVIEKRLQTGDTAETARQDQVKLQTAILDEMLLAESALQTDVLVFLDYALPDNIAFGEMENITVPGVKEAAEKYKYKTVFLFEPLPMVNDEVRNEDSRYQLEIHSKLNKVYSQLGYEVVHVGIGTPEERVDLLMLSTDPANKWLQRTQKTRR